MARHRIFDAPYASIHPHYETKVTRKGRTPDELFEVVCWLTGYDRAQIEDHIAAGTTLEDFFNGSPAYNPSAELITGSICGVRITEIEDPLMKQIRQLDKLVDELARGRGMEKILRGPCA